MYSVVDMVEAWHLSTTGNSRQGVPDLGVQLLLLLLLKSCHISSKVRVTLAKAPMEAINERG